MTDKVKNVAEHEEAAAHHLALADIHERKMEGDDENVALHGRAKEKHLDVAGRHLRAAGHPIGVTPDSVKERAKVINVPGSDEFVPHASDKMLKSAGGADGIMSMSEDKIPGGLADGKKPEDFCPEALAEGKKVESEHTSDPKIAEEIAMDHLTEDKDYYKKLKTIEKKCPLKASMVPKPGADKRQTLMKEKCRLTKAGEEFVKACCGFMQKEKEVEDTPRPASLSRPAKQEEKAFKEANKELGKSMFDEVVGKFRVGDEVHFKQPSHDPKQPMERVKIHSFSPSGSHAIVEHPTRGKMSVHLSDIHEIADDDDGLDSTERHHVVKSFDDNWLISLSDKLAKIAAAQVVPYSMTAGNVGTERDYTFKIGNHTVVYKTMGAEAKVNLSLAPTSDAASVRVAKACYYGIQKFHQDPLTKAGKKKFGRWMAGYNSPDHTLSDEVAEGERHVRRAIGRGGPSTGSGASHEQFSAPSKMAPDRQKFIDEHGMGPKIKKAVIKKPLIAPPDHMSSSPHRETHQMSSFEVFGHNQHASALGQEMVYRKQGLKTHTSKHDIGGGKNKIVVSAWAPKGAKTPAPAKPKHSQEEVTSPAHFVFTKAGEEFIEKAGRTLFGSDRGASTWQEGLGDQELRREKRRMSMKRGYRRRKPIKNRAAYRLRTQNQRLFGGMEEHIGKGLELTPQGEEFVKAFGLDPNKTKLKHTPGVSMKGRTNIARNAGAHKPTPGVIRTPSTPSTKAPKPSIKVPAVHKAMGNVAVKPKMPSVKAPKIDSPKMGKCDDKKKKMGKGLGEANAAPDFGQGSGQNNMQ